MQTWVLYNNTLITQNPVLIFKATLKLGFYTNPRFKLFVIPPKESI